MTKILRNAILAAVAITGLAGTAVAQQQVGNSCSNHDGYWGVCLGGEGHDHQGGGGHGRDR